MAGFIKFDGVDGESKDDKHKGWSDLVSFTQPITRPASGTGAHRRRGDVVMHDVTIVKEIDKSTPKLAESIVKGKVWPKVEIHLTASYTDSSRITYYAYELKNVQVNNYNIGGSSQAEDVVTEEMSLNFEEIKVTYTENDAGGKKKGNVEYTWKIEEGTK